MPSFGVEGFGLIVIGIKGKNYWRTGAVWAGQGRGADIKTWGPIFTPADGFYFSSKIADGTPGGGLVIPVGGSDMLHSVFSVDGTSTIDADTTPGTSTCFSSTNNTWNLTNTAAACNFLIKAQF